MGNKKIIKICSLKARTLRLSLRGASR